MLGCGCLGGIRYFDTKMPGSKGTIKRFLMQSVYMKRITELRGNTRIGESRK